MAVTDKTAAPRVDDFDSGAPTPQEHQDVELLVSMMGPACHYDVALQVLRKCGGDVEKAVGTLLEQNVAAEAAAPRTPPPSKPERGSPSVIDLTQDDEDFSRALAASLEDQGSTLRPSDRAPDPAWAVVPSNVNVQTNANVSGLSQEDQHLNRAIEASLNYEMMDSYHDLPLEQRVRVGDTPVSLRPTQPTYAYAGLVMHGLFFVPQVRKAVARYRPLTDEKARDLGFMTPPKTGPDHTMWSLLETFVNMDLARTTELNIDEALEAFDAEPWKNPATPPGEHAFQFYGNLAWVVETILHRNEATLSPSSHWHRLFHFRYGFSDADRVDGPFDKRHDMAIVRVAIPGTPDANDLLSCLALELAVGRPELGKQQVIFEPSDVVAFHLYRTHVSTGSKTERTIFKYPTHVYLDQFLKENGEVAGQRRQQQRELYEEIETLKKKRETLTKHNDRDVLADLRSAVHYYEQIADDKEDLERKSQIHEAARRLRKILTKIENELQTIDLTITKHQAKAATAYDAPELQQHRYDLRVVLVHDGLYGRNRVYSYIKQRDKWWKTVDYQVTEVTEESVLNDSIGLHLNAGPFLLIYSRAISLEEENERPDYPTGAKDSVKHNNAHFFGAIPPERLVHVIDPNSPPSTPAEEISQVPSLSSSIAEPPGSPRAEPMDLDVDSQSH